MAEESSLVDFIAPSTINIGSRPLRSIDFREGIFEDGLDPIGRVFGVDIDQIIQGNQTIPPFL